jgi:subtilisin-like proprotein convertase family protein
VKVIASSTGEEDGILVLLGCPVNFISTVLSDQAAVNLRDGTAPYSGTFNVEHPSVVHMPLSHFNGENVHGVWTLTVKDEGRGDTGTLNAWSLRPTLSALPCDGDFDHSGSVTISVTIDELIKAVTNALNGCP